MKIRAIASWCVMGASLLVSMPAAGQCLAVDVFVSGGVYEAGDDVPVELQLHCDGGQWCGPCQIDLSLNSGCGPQVGAVSIGANPPGSFGALLTVISLPTNLPPGAYHVCASPSCPGCFSICDTCCDCCPCSDSVIIVRCPADVDGDGAIDVGDLLAVLANWGPCVGCPADVDHDGLVGFEDLLQVLMWWGPCE